MSSSLTRIHQLSVGMAITVEDWLTVSIYLVHFSLVESPTWRGL
ncbi:MULTISPECIES: hypothetical protein [Rhodococcus]|nr:MULTISPECIES: hypothetical protein [Rhodococcus]